MHGLLQMARTSKIKKQKQKKLQTTCPPSQTRAPMGSAVLFFFDFRGFCMVCSRWPEPRKSKKKQNNKTADHMSTESDKSPNGVCSFGFFFFDFRGFCMVCFAVYCCYHIKLPFTLRNPCRTLQNLAQSKRSHLPPPHPPLSKKNSRFTMEWMCMQATLIPQHWF